MMEKMLNIISNNRLGSVIGPFLSKTQLEIVLMPR